MRFPPEDFSRRNSVKPYGNLTPANIPPSIRMPVIKKIQKSIKVESKLSTDVTFSGGKDSWLPEYNPIEVNEVVDYKELKAHMNDILGKEVKKHNNYWQGALLCFINPLGNPMANFSIHYINNKAKIGSKLTQASLSTVGNFLINSKIQYYRLLLQNYKSMRINQ